MMIQKPLLTALAMLTVISWMVADSENSDAQLLQRLRSRIESRPILPVPNFRQSPPNEQSAQQPNAQPRVPNYKPSQQLNPKGGDSAANQRRVAPVDPEQAGVQQAGVSQRSAHPSQPNQRPASGIAPGPSQNGLPNQVLARPPVEQPADPNSDPWGSSILARQDKPSLGIQVVESRQGIRGLVVTGINPGSHAQESELRVGDVLVEIDGVPTTTAAQVSEILASYQGADDVRVRIVRDRRLSVISIPLKGQADPGNVAATSRPNTPASPASPDGPAITAEAVGSVTKDSSPSADRAATNAVVAGKKPALTGADSQSPEIFGLTFRDIEGQRGAIVTGVQANSPAWASGLKTDDRIVAVDGRLLVDADAFKSLLEQSVGDSTIDLRMVRDEKLLSAKMNPNSGTSVAANDAVAADTTDQSALQGLGAAIGGLLGGRPKQKPAEVDEMALEDGERVQQVDFEVEEVNTDPSPDPLSLEALEIQKSSDSGELLPPKKTPEQLQQEIEDLKQQIKELQEKN